jgi:hypothetical protein
MYRKFNVIENLFFIVHILMELNTAFLFICSASAALAVTCRPPSCHAGVKLRPEFDTCNCTEVVSAIVPQ